MIIYLYITSKSALCYGSMVKGNKVETLNAYTIFRLASNGLEIRIANKDIQCIQLEDHERVMK